MYQLINQKIFNIITGRRYFVKKNNKKIFSVRKYAGSSVSRASTFFTREPETVNWIDNFETETNFLDVGANIGIYSLYAASKKHKVVSLEPESLNFFLLNINIKDNEFEKYIKAYPLSAGEKIDINDLNLMNFKFGGTGHSFGSKIGPDLKEFKPVYSQGSASFDLDTFVDKISFKPNNIKIDVDGNENFVVNGMQRLLHSKELKSILIEANKKNTRNLEAIEKIKSHGFKENLKSGNENQDNYILTRV